MQILTKDASVTLYNASFNETYHNSNDGALQETLHKHILPAFALKKQQQHLKILDICFGLGLNALCAFHHLKELAFLGEVILHSPEIDTALLLLLKNHSYPKELEFSKQVINALQKQQEYHNNSFHLYLHLGEAREILKGFLKNGNQGFDIIFQDPFSPLKNHTLWTFEYFKILYALSSDDVVITTYSHNSSMLYSAFLAGFYAFKLVQKDVRDSVILTKTQVLPDLDLECVEQVVRINMEHKIKTNPKLKGLYD